MTEQFTPYVLTETDVLRTEKLNNMLMGKLNSVLDVTLRANETTTTVIDVRISIDSYIGLQPLTSTARASGTYVSLQGDQTLTLTHNNTADTDKTFRLLIIG